jgi:2,4-didehydro-3-deoxy-L-rhamnonate hydrolase
MKLLRYGPAGREKPGMLDAQGRIRSLVGVLSDIDGAALSPASLRALAKLDVQSLPLVRGNPRIGACVAGVGKFLGIGLNYADHAVEAGMATPKEPILFTKAISCISGPNDDVPLPQAHGVLSKQTDWEVELGVVIGKRARYVSEADALNFVAGYCLVNDITERGYQLERGGTWDKGKGCDAFGPIGPWLVTRDEIIDPQNLTLELDLNGKPMQRGNTRTMIFGVARLVSEVSQFMTLEPGDLITTGTPLGVGMGIKDKSGKPKPRYLKRGDVMTLRIEGLGSQVQRVV